MSDGVIDRFWSKVEKTDDCWLWTGAPDHEGYGRLSVARQAVYAHRFSYELLVGQIPAGLQIDHLCRVRHCVNPNHMEAVTPRENTLRGVGATARNARKTHCPAGHALTPDNFHRDGQHPTARGKCGACGRARAEAWRLRNLEKVRQYKRRNQAHENELRRRRRAEKRGKAA